MSNLYVNVQDMFTGPFKSVEVVTYPDGSQKVKQRRTPTKKDLTFISELCGVEFYETLLSGVLESAEEAVHPKVEVDWDPDWTYQAPNPAVYEKACELACLGVPIEKAIRRAVEIIFGKFPEKGVQLYVDQFNQAFPRNQEIIDRFLANKETNRLGQSLSTISAVSLGVMAQLCTI